MHTQSDERREEPALPEMLSQLRGAGYMVAVHNDYKLHGAIKTFWLFTHPATGTFLKGEGLTDERAVQLVLDQTRAGKPGQESCKKPALFTVIIPKGEKGRSVDYATACAIHLGKIIRTGLAGMSGDEIKVRYAGEGAGCEHGVE